MVGIQKIWYRMSADEVLDFCDTNLSVGLTDYQVKARSEKYGYNKPLIFNIKSADFYEYKTLRNGIYKSVASNKLVLGDVVKFKAGDIVPANFRIIKVNRLRVNEEHITGNYASTAKNSLRCQTLRTLDKRTNMLFMGSQVINGQALAVLVSDTTIHEFNAKNIKTNRLLRLNNFVSNKQNLGEVIKRIDCVIFEDLKYHNEITETVASIFLANSIACIYLLDDILYKSAKEFLHNPTVIHNTSKPLNLGCEVAIALNNDSQQVIKILAQLRLQGKKTLYVYRGEKFKPEAVVADLNLVINKNSSHEALFNASILTNGINHTQLSRILYNKN